MTVVAVCFLLGTALCAVGTVVASEYPASAFRGCAYTHHLGGLAVRNRRGLPSHPTATAKRSMHPSKASETDNSSQEAADTSSQLDRLVSSIGKSTSTVVSGTCLLSFCYWRDAMQLTLFVGAISNGVVAKVLKKVLGEERPGNVGNDEFSLEKMPSDNGMPSSHATSLGFLCTFAALKYPWTTFPLAVYVSTSLYYRVKTKLHTKEQVLVGLVLGVTNCLGWTSLMYGRNPFGIHLIEWVNAHVLPSTGVVPPLVLGFPLVVFLYLSGNLERVSGKFLELQNRRRK